MHCMAYRGSGLERNWGGSTKATRAHLHQNWTNILMLYADPVHLMLNFVGQNDDDRSRKRLSYVNVEGRGAAAEYRNID